MVCLSQEKLYKGRDRRNLFADLQQINKTYLTYTNHIEILYCPSFMGNVKKQITCVLICNSQ